MFSINKRAAVYDSVCFAFLFLLSLSLLFQPNEEELLNLGRNSLLLLAGLFLGAVLSIYFNKFGIRTWGEQIFLSAKKRALDESTPFLKTFWGWQAIVVLMSLLIVGLYKTDFSLYELADENGREGAYRLFKGLFNPDWSVLPIAIVNIIETVFMAFMATALAIPIAFVLSFFSAKNIMTGRVSSIVYLTLRTIMNVTRSIEALVWAIIFSVWVGVGPFAGMLALMIHSVASLTKQYSEMVEAVDEGPIEGILSTGATRVQMIWFAVVPQVLLPYISFTVYRWDINVRMATIIGLVGGGGIGTLLVQYQGQALWPQVGCLIVVIAVVVWLLDQGSAFIREALK